MVKKLFLALLISSFLLAVSAPALGVSTKPIPTAEWSWLQKQVASGTKEIKLPGNVTREADEAGLEADATVTILGNGYSITGAQVDRGTVIFQDITLMGTHGVRDENGGAALTLCGEGTVAVLAGVARAIGGRSGPEGERGGDGVLLTGAKQGALLRGKAYAQGGAGHLYGGAGIRVEGCAGSALLTDTAASVGAIGLANGGAGVDAPACAKVQLRGGSTAVGGPGVYTGGNGIHSPACTACEDRQSVAVTEKATVTSGLGQEGGSAIWLERATPGDASDLTLSDGCTLIGGAGGTAGSAVRAVNVSVAFAGEPLLFSGDYFAEEAPVLDLTDCETTGDLDAATQTEGAKTEKNPASDTSLILNTELSQISDRYTPVLVENGLTTLDLATKRNGLSVEKGNVSRVTLGGGLKINLWNETLEKRLDFKQHLSDDSAEGTRLILVARSSEQWLTLEAAVTSLNKLLSLGVTQIAYTSAEPVYCERILDIASLLAAIEADKEATEKNPIDHVYLGTADDCVIFQYKDGTRAYQEELMQEARRYLEE